ncbi:MauE/DoxX family redox-associated membrane protein [Micromonospora sp. NPDC004551]|uniref:MauE/DoxX family redox-associated membrane protein n=1 Tax=Micromonospora sp. NPDC004551 TaxID=3154284 RepID=UPI0033AD9E9D
MSYLSVGLVATLWCVFAASAWSKLRSRAAQRAFADSLRPLPLLPGRLVGPAAAAVTGAEAAIVLGLGWSLVAALAGWPGARAVATLVLLVTSLLLAVLTTGVVLAVRRRTGARCACFGAAERPLGRRHVVRNGLLLAGVAVGLVDAIVGSAHRPAPAGAAVAVLAGVLGAAVLIRLDDLVELFLPIGTAPPAAPTHHET